MLGVAPTPSSPIAAPGQTPAQTFAQLLRTELRGTTTSPADQFLVPPGVLLEGTRLVLDVIADEVNQFDPPSVANQASSHAPPSYLSSCEAVLKRLEGYTEIGIDLVRGYVALICLNVRLLERRLGKGDGVSLTQIDMNDSDNQCKALFADHPRIRDAINGIYHPDSRFGQDLSTNAALPDVDAKEREQWNDIDSSSFKYLRAGTTSFILSFDASSTNQTGVHETRALKLVLFPWCNIPTIAQSTRAYAAHYATGKTLADNVVPPIYSSSKWIVMKLHTGVSLAEHLADWNKTEPTAEGRIGKARQVGKALIAALDILAKRTTVEVTLPETQHQDLSPGNVMVTTTLDTFDVEFVDLGRNHLYSRQVGIPEHDDSIYVAPAVKARGADSTADIYSIGIMMIAILTGHTPRAAEVPDAIYTLSPELGSFLDDLIDADLTRRLLLSDVKPPFPYSHLMQMFEATFGLVEIEPGRSTARARRARLLPSSSEPASQLKKFWGVGELPATDFHPAALMRRFSQRIRLPAAYLTLFSGIGLIAYWFTALKSTPVSLSSLIPPDPALSWNFHGEQLYAAFIAFSQALVAGKYYQTILARLTVRDLRLRQAKITELSMRLMTFVALPTLILAVLWKPNLWAYTCAFGAVGVAASNLLVYLFAKRLFRVGHRYFSTVRDDQDIPAGFDQWWWSMLLYAGILGTIAVGLSIHWMQDEAAYVAGLVLVTIGIHYFSKCVRAGFVIRGGLARAFSVGERLSRLEDRTGAALDWSSRAP